MSSLSLLLVLACAKKAPEPVAVAAPLSDPHAWRATQPAPAAEEPWTAPTASRFELKNGIPVYLVENPNLPLVTVQVVMAVGREANPKGKAGAQALTASMLDEGTKKRTGAQLAADLGAQGAELSVWGSGDNSMVVLDALGGAALPPALDLLAEVLLSPRFDKGDFARVKQQTLDQIAASTAEPRDVASRAFQGALFGPAHPFGSAVVGDEASVKALALSDVQALYKTWWHSGNATLVVSGAITQAELKTLLDARLGGWAKGKATRGELPAPPTVSATRILFKEHAGAVQSVIHAGRVAMPRTSPEFPAANVAGTLFGGMFGSPLNMNLREEKGWSYGAFGGFSEDRAVGVFRAAASVQADKTAPAVAEILGELQEARREPTAEELKLSRDYLIRSLPGSFEGNRGTAGAFALALANGQGTDAFTAYAAEMNGPDAAAVGASATKWFDPAAMTVVVIGPAKAKGDDGVEIDTVEALKALGHSVEVL